VKNKQEEKRRERRKFTANSLLAIGVGCLLTLPTIGYSKTTEQKENVYSDEIRIINAELISQQLDDSPLTSTNFTPMKN